jgi:hypothetical protein
MIHNLDQMTGTLNDPKIFPSRISVSKSSVKSMENIVRRLYRYFSHTYHHHSDIFFEFEVIYFIYTLYYIFNREKCIYVKDLLNI